ncbi:serine hydrolase [Patescibacteria group bacterium]|nr:serine hydrolase [Patescibacteria group bacterium]
MNSNLRIFAAALLMSAPFWWGINLLSSWVEEGYAEQRITAYANVLAASGLQEKLESRLPIRRNAQDPEMETTAVLSLLVREDGTQRILFAQNSQEPLPIASLTKLMTSYVTGTYYADEQEVLVSPRAVEEWGTAGDLYAGETFFVSQLLAPLLLESSNDAAAALAEVIGKEEFISLMNEEADLLGMKHTSFKNATGLDEEEPNRSSAEDTALIFRRLQEELPSVFQLLGKKELVVETAEGVYHHVAFTTNELLRTNNFPVRILAGKTGETPRAKGALVIATETPTNKGYLVFVVLGSEDRFGEMRNLVEWTISSHSWSLPPLSL